MTRLPLAVAICAVLVSCEPGHVEGGEDMIVVEKNSPAIAANVLVESVGLETIGGVFTSMLESGRSVPCEISRVFSTAADEQDQITLTLYRGRAGWVRDAHRLGQFRVTGFPQAPRGTPQVEVRILARGWDLLLVAQDKKSREKYRVERVD